MKREYLYGTDYTIRQSEKMFRVNSDTELLGLFMRIRKSDSVLDIGTNNGALLLYAASRHPSALCGIDIFPEAVSLAAENLAYCGVKGELYCTPLQEFSHAPFDAIVCNPPYFPFSGKMVSDDPFLAAARHEKYLPLKSLFENVSRLMKEKGRFYLVHRADRLNDIFAEAETVNMRISRMRIAYETEGKNAKSVLMEIVRGTSRQMIIEPPAYLDVRETFAGEAAK